jgi:beta-galactosidase
VRRKTGDGWAWVIGSYVGHSGTAYCSADSHRAVELLLEACGVLTERVGSLLLRKRVIAGKEAWILTNPGPDAVTETINVSEWQTVEDMLDDDLQHSGRSVTLTVESLDVRVLVLEA